MDDILKASFAPVFDTHTRLLVLGSLPGEASLALGQYYGNPRNQFWDLVGEAIGAPLPTEYAARLVALQAAGIGLWDVVRTARRRGSLDGAIRDHAPNALAEFVADLPALRAVAFNGGKSAAIGRRLIAETEGRRLIDLPSSSPAYTMSFQRKAEVWRTLRPFLAAQPS